MNIKHIHINYKMQRFKIVFFFILMFGFETVLFSQSTEYMMKAVALEKISLFISWPENTLKNDPSNAFVICVFGQKQFGEILTEVYKEKKIKNKIVKIANISNIQEISDCQMLFIPKIKTSELIKVLNYVKRKPILTISDNEGFAEAGCFINFYEYENKLRFEINQKGMKDAGFNIDYRLLRVSKVLNPVIE
jgi:hypothetical protein